MDTTGSPSRPIDIHLAARSIAHGTMLRVLVANAIEQDPSLEERFARIIERDTDEIEDADLKELVLRELRSIFG